MDVYVEAGGFDGDASYSEAKRGGGGNNQRGPQNLTPITCSDVHSMSGEKLMFGDHQAEKVSLVGMVRSVDVTSLRAVLVVDDRTGPAVVCHSMDPNDPELERITDGMYIKIFGQIRRQTVNKDEGMKTLVTVIKIRALTSINDVSRHMLECIHARMSYLTKEKRAELAKGGSSQSAGASMQTAGASGMGAAVGSGGDANLGSSGVNGLNRNQEMVYLTIRAGGALGIHLEKVTQKLSTHGLKLREIRDSVEFLQNEGHVYTTVDDETFACVDGV